LNECISEIYNSLKPQSDSLDYVKVNHKRSFNLLITCEQKENLIKQIRCDIYYWSGRRNENKLDNLPSNYLLMVKQRALGK
jgi:hypothetical protein